MLVMDQVYLFHINSSYDRTDADVSDCHGFGHALNKQKPTVEGKHSITQRAQYSSIVKKSIFRNLQCESVRLAGILSVVVKRRRVVRGFRSVYEWRQLGKYGDYGVCS